jgi:hypothetical protein
MSSKRPERAKRANLTTPTTATQATVVWGELLASRAKTALPDQTVRTVRVLPNTAR